MATINVRNILPSIKKFVNTYKPKFSSACHYPMVFDEDWYDEWGYNASWWKDYYSQMDDDFDGEYTVDIYFYYDIKNTSRGGQTECDEHFTSIEKLKEYCEETGIEVRSSELDMIRNLSTGHCCIDPVIFSKEKKMSLVCDRSYGALLWRCCDDDTDLW